MKTRKGLCYAATLLALFCLASCAETETDSTLLPAGKYPMTFTTAVNELATTRATSDNTWEGTEQIALQIGKDVKQYAPNAAGASTTLSSTDPFYWTSSKETKSVSAWHYGDGYSPSLKTSWTVQSDQSGTGTTLHGYQKSDFLYAPAQNISFSGDKSLSFYHQTARVVINIVNAEEATEASQILSVTLGDNKNLALSGTYTAPEGEATTGTWNLPSSASMGTVTPKDITTPDGDNYLKTYTALLIPQNMKDKKFIVITLTDGSTYYYTPQKNTEANFQAGKEYTYKVTVKYGHLDAVLVNVSGMWQNDGQQAVTSKTPVKGFSADDLKMGDYFYSDGTTSDGGYRKYTVGSQTLTEVLDISPVLNNNGQSRNVIGIVFYVGQHGTDNTDYSSTGIGAAECNGYFMALTDVNNDQNSMKWADGDVSHEDVGTEKSQTDWNGYGNTQRIQKYVVENASNTLTIENFPAANGCINFGGDKSPKWQQSYAAPVNTSGWFLPSCGQLNYLTDHSEVLSKIVSRLGTSLNNSHVKWFAEEFYWTSSEVGADNAYTVFIPSGGEALTISTLKNGDDYMGKVRAVCAF